MAVRETKKSYKTELKISLIKNTLMHILIVSVFGCLGALALYFFSSGMTLQNDSTKIGTHIDNAIESYSNILLDEYEIDYFEKIKTDRDILRKEYYKYLDLVKKMPLKADFYLFNNTFDIVLQSQYPADFALSSEQTTKQWSTFGKIWSNPVEVVVDFSMDFRGMSGLSDLIVGKGIVVNNVVIGYIVFCIDEKTISEYTSLVTTDIVVAHASSSILSFSNMKYTQLHEFAEYDFDKHSLVGNTFFYKTKTKYGNFQILSFLDISEVKTTAIIIFVSMMLFLAVIFFVLIKASNKFSIQKTQYLDEIIFTFRQVEREGLNKRMREFDIIEFDEISQEYNKMLDDIQRLMNANEEKTQENYVSVIKQLEMQFNSHFLFNTLENIRFMISNMPQEAMNCIVNLSEILRYSINNDNQYVTLQEDVKYTKRYLEILQLRFGERLSYSIDIPENVNSFIIPKLIIQPIIENAVKYAYDKKDALTLNMSAKAYKKKLIINISDDSVGMSTTDLKKIRHNLNSEVNTSNHIGLYNVNKRLRLIYGKGYGVEIHSEKNIGTTVTLTCGNMEKNND